MIHKVKTNECGSDLCSIHFIIVDMAFLLFLTTVIVIIALALFSAALRILVHMEVAGTLSICYLRSRRKTFERVLRCGFEFYSIFMTVIVLSYFSKLLFKTRVNL